MVRGRSHEDPTDFIALPDLGLRAACRVIWEIDARMEWSPLGARDLGSGTRGGGSMGRLGE